MSKSRRWASRSKTSQLLLYVEYFPFRTHKPGICCGHSRALLFIYPTHATLQCSDAVATADGGVAAAQLLSDFEHQALCLPPSAAAGLPVHASLPALSAPEDCWKPPLTDLPCHPPPAHRVLTPTYPHLTTLQYITTTLSIPTSPCDTLHAAPSQRTHHLTAPPRRPVHTSAATRDPCPQLDDGTSQCALAQGT